MANQNSPQTHTVTRRLTPEAQETKSNIISAARGIIEKEGHESLQIAKIAKKTGVARITIYRYFSSREHIIVEALSEWAWSTIRTFQIPATNEQTSFGEHITAFVRFLVQKAAENPNMIRATIASIASNDPSTRALQDSFKDSMGIILNFVGSHFREDPRVLKASSILGHLLLGNFILLCADNTTIEASVSEITSTLKLLVGDIWGESMGQA